MRALLLLPAMCFSFGLKAQYKDSTRIFERCTKQTEKHTDFRYIPAGSYARGSNDSDLPSPDLNGYYYPNHNVSVDAFFMQRFEVSNANYREFVISKLAEDSLKHTWLLPDSLVWRHKNGYYEAYVDYYFRHPVYNNYPVVGVSYEKAMAYVEWMTEQYNANEDRAFKKVRFRLPTEEEWEYACKGGHQYSYLPWGTSSTTGAKGQQLANFVTVNQLGIYRDSVLQPDYSGGTKRIEILRSTGSRMPSEGFDDADLIQTVDSYAPNAYGLYNMAGNVEEMVDAYYMRNPTMYQWHQVGWNERSDAPWGVTKGGSWNDTGYYLQYPVRQFYDGKESVSREIGFRLVMEVIEY